MGIAQGNAEEEGLIVLALQKFDGGVGYRSIALQALAQAYLGVVQDVEATDMPVVSGQVSTAGPSGAVTGSAEQLTHIGQGRVRRHSVDQDPGLVRQTTGHQAAARRTTYRCGTVGQLEACT